MRTPTVNLSYAALARVLVQRCAVELASRRSTPKAAATLWLRYPGADEPWRYESYVTGNRDM